MLSVDAKSSRRARKARRVLSAQGLDISYELTYPSEETVAAAEATVAAGQASFNSALETSLSTELAAVQTVVVSGVSGASSAGGSTTTAETAAPAPAPASQSEGSALTTPKPDESSFAFRTAGGCPVQNVGLTLLCVFALRKIFHV